MDGKEELRDTALLLSEPSVALALESLENFAYRNPKIHLGERLASLREEYDLMVDFWRRGFDDASRAHINESLRARLHTLAIDAAVRYANLHNPYLTFLCRRGTDGTVDANFTDMLRLHLEKFVTDLALLELEQPHVAAERRKTLHETHQKLMADAFDALVVSCAWTEGVADALRDIALSPTIDPSDQQMLVSATTMACLDTFDPAKWRMLYEVYRGAQADENVRQRALVGWAFTADGLLDGFGQGMAERVKADLQADEAMASELVELQMQLVYCMQADADNRTINDEIMPELVDYAKRHQYPGEQTEDDVLRDIIDPEASEREMERVEQGYRRMMGMQKEGSDIYFSGFAQMKRFPFFSVLSNWFVPFSFDHPGIASLMEGTAGDMVRKMRVMFPFCNSDWYSFAIACHRSFEHIPEALRERVAETQLPKTSPCQSGQFATPAHIRRGYLQDLYRFFRLFPSRESFVSPFSDTDFMGSDHFLASQLYDGTPVRSAAHSMDLASFFAKRKCMAAAVKVLEAADGEIAERYEYHILRGAIATKGNGMPYPNGTASESYAAALRLKAGDRKARAGLARAYFTEGRVDDAAKVYGTLVDDYPDAFGYTLSYVISLVAAGRFKDALPILFKATYEHPDNLAMKRVLVRALLGSGDAAQALKYAEPLAALDAESGGDHEDRLLLGIALWQVRRKAEAAREISAYLRTIMPSATTAEMRVLFSERVVGSEISQLKVKEMDPLEIDLMKNEVAAQY